MSKPPTHFRNGQDIHFDYSNQPSTANANSVAAKKKKRKSKKSKLQTKTKTSHFSLSDASINDPNVDYPTSRVIKVGPTGDVIVESLDDEYQPPGSPRNEQITSATSSLHPSEPHEGSADMSLFQFSSDAERSFWENLPEKQRRDILRVDKDVILSQLRLQRKNEIARSGALDPKYYASSAPPECSCPACGRNKAYIEERLNAAYEFYLDDIAEYLQLFEDPNFRLMHPPPMQTPFMYPPPLQPSNDQHHSHSPPLHDDFDPEDEAEVEEESLSRQIIENDGKMDHSLSSTIKQADSLELGPSLPPTPQDKAEELAKHENYLMSINPEEALEILRKAKKVLDLINPTTVQELVKYQLLQKDSVAETLIDESAKNLTEIFASIKNEDENGVLKAVEFIKCCSRLYKDSNDQYSDVLQFLSNFADLIMKNDGRTFVDMLETLSDARNARISLILDETNPEEELAAETETQKALESPLHADDENADARVLDESENEVESDFESERPLRINTDGNVDEKDLSPEEIEFRKQKLQAALVDFESGTNKEPEYKHEHEHEDDSEHEHDDDDHDDEYSYEHDCEHGHSCGHDCDLDNDDNYDGDSYHDYDDDSEFDLEQAKQERIEEIRGFFMIQSVHVIRQRFKEAYEKKLSEDRTQKFIEELEAEENAKKEKELKKQKQKEKQKEKKRLQQLAKEEEKRKKELEEQAKADELKRKQDEIRAEQKRKKDEIRMKKEEEKRKRVEALRQKELEQQKLAEQKRLELEEQQKKLELEKAQQAKKEQEELEKQKARELEQQVNEAREKAELARQEQTSEQNQRLSENLLSSDIPPLNMPAFDQEELLRKTLDLSLAEHGLLKTPGGETGHSPMKNHLLDQLYQARPRSLSSTSPSIPKINGPDFNGLPMNEVSGMYGQRKPSVFSQDPLGAWSNGQQFPPPAQPQQRMSPNGTQFSPFGPHETLDTWKVPSNVDAFQPAMNRGSGLWSDGLGAKNSIWNTTPKQSNGSIWGNPQAPSRSSGSRVSLGQDAGVDKTAAHNAAVEAYQLLQSSNQATFGAVEAGSFFQVAKGIMGKNDYGMADFLGAISGNNGQSAFDLVYDNFGSVTHVKPSTPTVPPQMNVPLRQGVQPPLFHQPFPRQQPVQQPLQQQTPLQPVQPMQQGIFPQQPLQQDPIHLQQPLNRPLQGFGSSTPHVPSAVRPQQEGALGGLDLSFLVPQGFSTGSMNGSRDLFQESELMPLPGAVQGLLNQLGFSQRGSIW